MNSLHFSRVEALKRKELLLAKSGGPGFKSWLWQVLKFLDFLLKNHSLNHSFRIFSYNSCFIYKICHYNSVFHIKFCILCFLNYSQAWTFRGFFVDGELRHVRRPGKSAADLLTAFQTEKNCRTIQPL